MWSLSPSRRGRSSKYTVQPGAQFPWHSHAGPVVVNLVTGALTSVPAESCEPQYVHGGAGVRRLRPGHVHTAYNPTSAATAFVATFYDAPAEGSLLIPAPAGC